MIKNHIRELVVLSSKVGTDKTSITASFAVLTDEEVLVDCDVDAATLHLLLTPEVEQMHIFQRSLIKWSVPPAGSALAYTVLMQSALMAQNTGLAQLQRKVVD